MSSKRSRVHPEYKTKYRVKNWTDYDRALVAGAPTEVGTTAYIPFTYTFSRFTYG